MATDEKKKQSEKSKTSSKSFTRQAQERKKMDCFVRMSIHYTYKFVVFYSVAGHIVCVKISSHLERYASMKNSEKTEKFN